MSTADAGLQYQGLNERGPAHPRRFLTPVGPRRVSQHPPRWHRSVLRRSAQPWGPHGKVTLLAATGATLMVGLAYRACPHPTVMGMPPVGVKLAAAADLGSVVSTVQRTRWASRTAKSWSSRVARVKPTQFRPPPPKGT